MTGARLLKVVLAAFLISGCGYFNSLYNANRRFSDAERRVDSGEFDRAAALYRETIDKASHSYRKYPSSRWADDALLLIGRSWFALEQDEASAAALRTLLAQSTDPAMRYAAHAVLGAVQVRMEHADSALMHLDSAVHGLEKGNELASFSHLWRARAALTNTLAADAWADLDAASRDPRTAFDAAIIAATHSMAERDSARFTRSMSWLAAASPRGRAASTVTSLLRSVSTSWSPVLAYRSSESLERARWPNSMIDSLALERSGLAAAAGDTAAAIQLAMRVAEANRTGIGSTARLLVAQTMLNNAAAVEDLETVRVVLLPAFEDGRALALMRTVKAAQILALRGAEPASALSTFAAAELVRDELAAPRLARTLFLAYARTVPEAVWAGKALLAAHDITPDNETSRALDSAAANAYVMSANGRGHSNTIDQAEERLALGLLGIRTEALAEAVMRDVIVGRAVTILDSTRSAARNDSLRIACGTMVDSLRVTGIRADSTRSACVRRDAQRIAAMLAIDTVLLRDTSDFPRGRNEIGLPRTTRVRPDTIQRRP